MDTMVTSSIERSNADCSPDSTTFWLSDLPSPGLTIALCEVGMSPGSSSEILSGPKAEGRNL